MRRPEKNRWGLILYLLFIAILIICMALMMFFFVGGDMGKGLILTAVPFGALLVSSIFISPIFGAAVLFTVNYIAIGLARYIPAPLGLSVDFTLVLIWLSLFFSQFNKKVDWGKASKPITYLAMIWFGYSLLQLFNPEAASSTAWFYAMRGVSLYMLLTIPLVFILFSEKKFLDRLIRLWTFFTILAVLKAMQQKYIGVDPWEDIWLNTVGVETHLLPGGIRYFSFFSDSAVFGGSMGFSSVVFLILAIHKKSWKDKIYFFFVGLFALFGLLISTTRGAMAAPAAGFALYALLSRRSVIIGLIYGGGSFLYVFLRYTNIGDSLYEIRRIRTSFDPNNPSMMVRAENKRILANYLSSRPFGGGIGSAGNWGHRFSPGTLLAETPTDGHFTQIWADQGIVGLYLHLSILAFFIVSSVYIILFRIKTFEYQGYGAAMVCGVFGVMACSYTSQALGQMPSGIITYAFMAYVWLLPSWEREAIQKGLVKIEPLN